MTKLAVILFISFCLVADSLKLKEKFSWVNVEFNWPSEQKRQQALAAKQYVPENNVIVGLEKWRNKLFVTIPR